MLQGFHGVGTSNVTSMTLAYLIKFRQLATTRSSDNLGLLVRYVYGKCAMQNY